MNQATDIPIWVLTVLDSFSLPPGHPPIVSVFQHRHVAMRRATERMLGHSKALTSSGVQGLVSFAGQAEEVLASSPAQLPNAFVRLYEEWVQLMANTRVRMFLQIQQQYPVGDTWSGRRQFVPHVIQALGELVVPPLPSPEVTYREIGNLNLAVVPTYHVTVKPVTNVQVIMQLITRYLGDPIEVIEAQASVIEVWRHFAEEPSILVRLLFSTKPGETRRWADNQPTQTLPAWQKPASHLLDLDDVEEFHSWINKMPLRVQLYMAGVALEVAMYSWHQTNQAPDSVARARIALETLNEWLECKVPAGYSEHWGQRLMDIRPDHQAAPSDTLSAAAVELVLALQTVSARGPFEALLSRTPNHIKLRSDFRDARNQVLKLVQICIAARFQWSLEQDNDKSKVTQPILSARLERYTGETTAIMRERLKEGEPYRVRPESFKN